MHLTERTCPLDDGAGGEYFDLYPLAVINDARNRRGVFPTQLTCATFWTENWHTSRNVDWWGWWGWWV